MSRPFAIAIRLAAPIAGGEMQKPPVIMLDGLLGFAVAQEVFDGQGYRRHPHRDKFVDLPLPLAEPLPGIWAASQGLVATGLRAREFYTRPYDLPDADTPGVQQHLPRPMLPVLYGLPLMVAPEIRFYGVGDLERCLDLLRMHIRYIGHKRGSGYGAVAEITGAYIGVDYSLARYDALEDRVILHRAIPTALDAEFAHYLEATFGPAARVAWERQRKEHGVAYYAARPPYYLPTNQVACFVPDAEGLATPEHSPFENWLAKVQQEAAAAQNGGAADDADLMLAEDDGMDLDLDPEFEEEAIPS